MSKTGSKQTEGNGFSSFDASNATEQVRFFAHKSAEQSRQAYERMKDGTEDARKVFEASFETARTAGDELVLKSLAAMEAGTEANVSQMEALAGAKSLSEVIELQGTFARKQMEFAADQARAFQAIFQKAGTDFSKPVRDAFDKAMKQTA